MTTCSAAVAATDDVRHRDPRAYSRAATYQGPRFEVVSGSQELPDWVLPVLERLQDLAKLGPNWSGEPSTIFGPSLAIKAVTEVLSLVMPADGGPVPHVFPTIDGGLQFEWHRGGWDVELSLSPLGDAWVDASSVDGRDEWEGPFSDVREDLKIVLKSIA
jgi:hypothetical protein